MDSRERIEALAAEFPANIRLLMRKELKKLPDLLAEGEEVVDLAQGRYEGKQGAVVLTDRRVLFTEEGVFRSRLEDFPYERISSVQTDKGMVFGKITIFASGNRVEIDQIVPKAAASKIGDYVRSRVSVGPAPLASAPAASGSSNDRLERLKALAELRDNGVLTEEEFAQEKAKVLSES